MIHLRIDTSKRMIVEVGNAARYVPTAQLGCAGHDEMIDALKRTAHRAILEEVLTVLTDADSELAKFVVVQDDINRTIQKFAADNVHRALEALTAWRRDEHS